MDHEQRARSQELLGPLEARDESVHVAGIEVDAHQHFSGHDALGPGIVEGQVARDEEGLPGGGEEVVDQLLAGGLQVHDQADLLHLPQGGPTRIGQPALGDPHAVVASDVHPAESVELRREPQQVHVPREGSKVRQTPGRGSRRPGGASRLGRLRRRAEARALGSLLSGRIRSDHLQGLGQDPVVQGRLPVLLDRHDLPDAVLQPGVEVGDVHPHPLIDLLAVLDQEVHLGLQRQVHGSLQGELRAPAQDPWIDLGRVVLGLMEVRVPAAAGGHQRQRLDPLDDEGRVVAAAGAAGAGLHDLQDLRILIPLDHLPDTGEVQGSRRADRVAQADHVGVEVRDHPIQGDAVGGIGGVVLRAQKAQLLPGPAAEDHGAPGLEAALGQGARHLHGERRPGGVVVGSVADVPVPHPHVVQVSAEDDVLVLQARIGPLDLGDDVAGDVGPVLLGDLQHGLVALQADLHPGRAAVDLSILDRPARGLHAPLKAARRLLRIRLEDGAEDPLLDGEGEEVSIRQDVIAPRPRGGAAPRLAALLIGEGVVEQQGQGVPPVRGLHLRVRLRLFLPGVLGFRLRLLVRGAREPPSRFRGRVRRAGEREDDLPLDVQARVLVEALVRGRDPVSDEDDLGPGLRAGRGEGVDPEVPVVRLEGAITHRQARHADVPLEAPDGHRLEPGAVLSGRFQAPLLEARGHPVGRLAESLRAGLATSKLVRGEEGDVLLGPVPVGQESILALSSGGGGQERGEQQRGQGRGLRRSLHGGPSCGRSRAAGTGRGPVEVHDTAATMPR